MGSYYQTVNEFCLSQQRRLASSSAAQQALGHGLAGKTTAKPAKLAIGLACDSNVTTQSAAAAAEMLHLYREAILEVQQLEKNTQLRSHAIRVYLQRFEVESCTSAAGYSCHSKLLNILLPARTAYKRQHSYLCQQRLS